MKITIEKIIKGTKMIIDIDSKDEREGLLKATFFLKPDICGLCKKTNIIWDGNVADGEFIYIKRKCLDCFAVSTAGEYKGGKGLFWKKWEIYQPKNQPSNKSYDAEMIEKDRLNNPNYENIQEENLPF